MSNAQGEMPSLLRGAVDKVKVDNVVRDLVADHDRLDGFLSEANIERLIEKRGLSVEECSEVRRQLDALGISVENEFETQDEIEISNIDAVYSVDGSLDLSLRSLSSRLLTAEEEVELGGRWNSDAALSVSWKKVFPDRRSTIGSSN